MSLFDTRKKLLWGLCMLIKNAKKYDIWAKPRNRFPTLLNSTQNDWNMQKHCLVFKIVHCGAFLFELISGFFKGVQTSLHEFQKYLTSWIFTAQHFQLSKNFFQKSSFRSTAQMILWLFSARLHWNPVFCHTCQNASRHAKTVFWTLFGN